VGWLTGGVSCAVLWCTYQLFPYQLAIVLAVLSRVLLTGALHEDGLADFVDGMGGGTSRERILAIMKDSHIGTYGVMALVFYYAVLLTTLMSLPISTALCALFCADVWSKSVASNIINFLPYSRTEEESKGKTVYSRMTWGEVVMAMLPGVLALMLFLPMYLLPSAIVPMVVMALLIALMHKKMGGYTGDCCGASFLMCELSFLMAVAAFYHTL
jgi:adenosylcobinamide-GDP ribazoletransferase